MDALVKASVAAALLGRPLSWVRWAAQNNVLPYYRVGRELRFSPEELGEWAARRRVPAADEGASVSVGCERRSQRHRSHGRRP
jgi:excisionase family DNA binding protein